MKTANVGTLRNNLSKYLDYVRKGGTIEILDRKTPIARLTPIEPSMKPTMDAYSPWVQKLIREGRARAPTKKLPDDWFEKIPHVPGARILEALLEERRTGR